MRNPVRVLAAVAVSAGLVLVAGPALAHVTVNPHEAEQGSYSKLTFRVPTESDTLSTTKVTVQLPTDHPLASVSVKPHPGWTFQVQKEKLATPLTTDDGQVTEAVSTITWTADKGSEIKPGEFDEFDISVGPLPDADSVEFKALQTYSDGSVVRWIDEAQAGQAEPEHPAPVLTLTPASDDTTASDTASPEATASDSSDTTATAAPDDDGDSKAPLVLSIIALVVAVAGAGVAIVRRRA
jgi:periplasmic copper chaperone A